MISQLTIAEAKALIALAVERNEMPLLLELAEASQATDGVYDNINVSDLPYDYDGEFVKTLSEIRALSDKANPDTLSFTDRGYLFYSALVYYNIFITHITKLSLL
jgi:hypothetical protein